MGLLLAKYVLNTIELYFQYFYYVMILYILPLRVLIPSLSFFILLLNSTIVLFFFNLSHSILFIHLFGIFLRKEVDHIWLCSNFTPGGVEGTICGSGIRSRSSTCKASTLSTTGLLRFLCFSPNFQ